MNPVLSALLGLQEIDRQIFKVESELERLPKEEQQRSEELGKLRERLAGKQQEVASLRAEIKDIEHTTVGLRQRLKKLESESSNGTADAALIASYQHEMRNIKRNVSGAEDDGLKRLGRAEMIDEEIAALQQKLAEDEAVFAEFQKNVAEETKAAEGKLADLHKERLTKSSDGISANELDIYRGLLKTREGEALAELGDGLCEGCFVNLPKNIVVRLARGTELVQCPSCDRILFTY
ncbi:Putative zinc ribbon domain protein [Planctomycetes bacterium Poly30]|uniref:Zinc ribbon domain protein n=1 Tax=Saltatorellus ferox TaxID=2528018 RepID=A0A518ERX3_9BACT|nr:Putative zinc ribbon domain protein [Planctomycetes bacterium Poly30]